MGFRAHLSIGTASNRVNLLAAGSGFTVSDWRPLAGDHEAVFAGSAMGDYRAPVSYRELTTIETITLQAAMGNADDMAREAQELRRVLRDALNYWTEGYSADPVYLKARGLRETNARYALVYEARLPEDEDPYGSAFLQPGGGSAMADLSLVVERGPWLEAPPGTGTCVQIAGYQADRPYPSYLNFDAASERVNFASGATLDDLHAAAFTFEGWFKITAADADDRFVGKEDGAAGTGWLFYFTAANSVRFRVVYGTPSNANYGWVPDGQWHHWAGTYNQAGDRKARLYLDGALVVGGAASVGVIVSDAADSLIVANRAAANAAPTGQVGWVRVSNSFRYAAGFTPPPRCTLPDVDAATVLLAIHEGTGTTAYDLSGNGNNGTITGATWACDCETDWGHTVPTCEAETVFVANKQNVAQLTHAFYYDASGPAWSGNLLTAALPYDLLPAVPAAGDAVYFGVESTILGGGPFCDLVFDLVAATDVTAATWEYWTGAAWAALSVQDNTSGDGYTASPAFNTSGVRSVHWEQPANWAAVGLVAAVGAGAPAVTAWWVRLRVTGVGGAPDAPRQQNRQPYTVTWPWIEIEADQVPGDIDAWLKLYLTAQSDRDLGTSPPALYWQQALIGLRTLARGADFTAYLNCSNVQNPAHITAAAGTATAFTALPGSPTGRVARVTNPAASWSNRCTFTIDPAYVGQYIGVYRAFARVNQTSGAAGDLSIRYRLATNTAYLDGPEASIPAVAGVAWEPVDLGRLEIPISEFVLPGEQFTLTIALQVYGNGASDVDLCDLILIPVDEWAILAVAGPPPSLGLASHGVGYRGSDVRRELVVDSIFNHKVNLRTVERRPVSGAISSIWEPRANGPAILRRGRAQRLWFFRFGDTTAALYNGAPFEICDTAQAWRAARYLSLRGAR